MTKAELNGQRLDPDPKTPLHRTTNPSACYCSVSCRLGYLRTASLSSAMEEAKGKLGIRTPERWNPLPGGPAARVSEATCGLVWVSLGNGAHPSIPPPCFCRWTESQAVQPEARVEILATLTREPPVFYISMPTCCICRGFRGREAGKVLVLRIMFARFTTDRLFRIRPKPGAQAQPKTTLWLHL